MNRSRSTTLIRALGVLAVVGLAVGCGSDSDAETSSSGPAAASGDVTVEVTGAWARTSPANVTTGAAYVVLTASADDALVAAEADASVAKMVEIHETVAAESTDMGADTTMAMGSDDSAPMAMTMQPVDKIDLPAGEAVALEPGGYHIMLMELGAPLEAGTSITIELIFEKAGTVPVTFEVRDDAP